MIIPAIGMVVGPAIYVYDITRLPQVWSAIADVRGLRALVGFAAIADASLLVLALWAAVLFSCKDHRAPRYVIVLLLARLVAQLIVVTWALAIAAGYTHTTMRPNWHLAYSIIYCLVWVPYFLVSKRVQATFVR